MTAAGASALEARVAALEREMAELRAGLASGFLASWDALRFATVADVAARLGVSRRIILRACADGSIPSIRLPHRVGERQVDRAYRIPCSWLVRATEFPGSVPRHGDR